MTSVEKTTKLKVWQGPAPTREWQNAERKSRSKYNPRVDKTMRGGRSSGEDRTEGWRPAGGQGHVGIRRMGRVRKGDAKGGRRSRGSVSCGLEGKGPRPLEVTRTPVGESRRARRLIFGPNHELTCARWLGRGGWGGGPWMEGRCAGQAENGAKTGPKQPPPSKNEINNMYKTEEQLKDQSSMLKIGCNRTRITIIALAGGKFEGVT
ncbi:hypothetical protein PABG_12576 [Paracoccidioides brasiliensis Pb03]|nr:hypothetical protein PABG_12576 [Paracoccidioides brasiliensis Pb03]